MASVGVGICPVINDHSEIPLGDGRVLVLENS
jgi:hypothetical protein